MQENGGHIEEREKEEADSGAKKREFSESESSWSSVEEIEIKAIAERNEEKKGDCERFAEEEPRTRPPRRKSKIGDHEVEVSEDREEAAQLRPLLTPSS